MVSDLPIICKTCGKNDGKCNWCDFWSQRVAKTKESEKHTYRKKPVVIKAFQMTEERRESNHEWPDWMHEAWQKDNDEIGALFPNDLSLAQDGSDKRLAIRTLEGIMQVSFGDWIIRGVKGELYPCKPDIFEQTYEPA